MSTTPSSDARGLGISRGLTWRIALVGIASGAAAIGITSLGVWVFGGEAISTILMDGGETAAHAYSMFDQGIRDVLVLAIVVATISSVTLALALSRMIAQPLAEVGWAARRIASGDYGARVPRRAPDELASLADSFNQMAVELEESERLRRDIIANTAHELRTPLTNLEGYLEAIRDNVIQPDGDTYESLLEETERLVRLAHSLDDLAAGDRDANKSLVADIDLTAQLWTATELARPAFDARGLTLKRHWPGRLPARADPDQLAQVLANLLQNAARYAPEGSVVTMIAEQRSDTVLVSLSNTGEGIPAEDMPHLFERFYRVEKSRDRARGGAGIGLAIVKQLVEGWGGRVGAESSAGHTRFWFSLPQDRGTSPDPA